MAQNTEIGENTTSSADIGARVRDVVGSLVPGGRREVETGDQLTDLGFDSLGTLELAMALETEFDLAEVPEGQAVEMATVGDIERLVSSLVGPTAAPGPE
ncbi:hypothetical protein GCM10022223_51140 [Kineosporia mesophila]|uniref:Carrier domain-containing protein n=1 Tax=Kineosporia mesophila TaxID=566012 RepID=A0ABP7A9K7_9ACTN|nr:phosphopantetheine-binding protein [Kineosporia mesophila]MCD5354697.1 phosphopantetheine-binding protein [Kineosporia mesophila]